MSCLSAGTRPVGVAPAFTALGSHRAPPEHPRHVRNAGSGAR